mgnify:CR=1 FL=1
MSVKALQTISILLLSLQLIGCGQTGPLYLPDDTEAAKPKPQAPIHGRLDTDVLKSR